jgi:uncharacterized protein YdeI (YjbR/CyaY-like superfamily)
MKATFFATPTEFRRWLEQHHKTEKELIVGFYKVSSGKPSLTWSQSVDQALCFGWIDGVRRSIDTESYCIRFTPRKSSSIWSGVNIKKMEELIQSGLMRPEGLHAFSLMSENKANGYSSKNKPEVLSDEYCTLFKSNAIAWEFFSKQAPSYKRFIIDWIMNAKQEKTRVSRLEKTIEISAQEQRMKVY